MIRCYRCGKEKEPFLFAPCRLPPRAKNPWDTFCRKCEAESHGCKFGDNSRAESIKSGRRMIRYEELQKILIRAKKQEQREEIKRLKAMREERLKKMAEQE